MIVHVDLRSSLPVYRQVADSIRVHLVSGRLMPGDQLPTIRQLGMDLGVNFNTIAAAYRILAEEGWLDLKRKKGATIRRRPAPQQPSPEVVRAFGQHLRELLAGVRAAGIGRETITKELSLIVQELEKELEKGS